MCVWCTHMDIYLAHAPEGLAEHQLIGLSHVSEVIWAWLIRAGHGLLILTGLPRVFVGGLILAGLGRCIQHLGSAGYSRNILFMVMAEAWAQLHGYISGLCVRCAIILLAKQVIWPNSWDVEKGSGMWWGTEEEYGRMKERQRERQI